MNCMPTGMDVPGSSGGVVNPAGMDRQGIAAKDVVTVKISAMYMAMGSSVLAPILNATVGLTGVRSMSTVLNASVKSCVIRVLAFRAFR
jgi:hypothetical protein